MRWHIALVVAVVISVVLAKADVGSVLAECIPRASTSAVEYFLIVGPISLLLFAISRPPRQ